MICFSWIQWADICTTAEKNNICFSWIQFADGSCSAMMLHQGDRASCEKVADGIPGVTTSSSKQIEKAGITICTAAEKNNGKKEV